MERVWILASGANPKAATSTAHLLCLTDQFSVDYYHDTERPESRMIESMEENSKGQFEEGRRMKQIEIGLRRDTFSS